LDLENGQVMIRRKTVLHLLNDMLRGASLPSWNRPCPSFNVRATDQQQQQRRRQRCGDPFPYHAPKDSKHGGRKQIIVLQANSKAADVGPHIYRRKIEACPAACAR
jgi:hypothetical protein